MMPQLKGTRWSEKWADLYAKHEAAGTLDDTRKLLITRKIAHAREVEKAWDEAAKNHGFTQVYQKGWTIIAKLASEKPGACKLYAAIARRIDPRFGALIATQEALGEACGMHPRNVRIHADYLEKEGYIVRFRAAGATAYCVDPAAVWCGRNTQKDEAAFVVGVLQSKSESKDFKVKVLGAIGRPGPRAKKGKAAVDQPADDTGTDAKEAA